MLRIYPNPTSNVLNVELLPATTKAVTLELVNITGQVLATQLLRSNAETIEVGSLLNGVYFIRVWQEGRLMDTQKFIKSE